LRGKEARDERDEKDPSHWYFVAPGINLTARVSDQDEKQNPMDLIDDRDTKLPTDSESCHLLVSEQEIRALGYLASFPVPKPKSKFENERSPVIRKYERWAI